MNVIALGLCIFNYQCVRSVLSQSEGRFCKLRDNLCHGIESVQCNNICLACPTNALPGPRAFTEIGGNVLDAPSILTVRLDARLAERQ